MAARETGKQRASRIPLDYYKGWTPLEKWFALGGIVAFVAAVAWPVGAFFLRSDNGNMLVSRGHVTAKHGAWDANCAACHDSFSPMNERVILSGSVSNQKCTNCHPGPQHAANQLTEQSCASCHRDHQGREHSMVRIPDSDCTTCHSNLPSHTKGGSPEYEKAVSRFNKDYHPEFRSLKSDPGKLKFNHKLHMSPGIVGGPNDAGTFTLARMDPADQERYKALLNITDLNAPLQLTCAACHATDSSAFGMKVSRMDVVPQALLFPQRSPGDYMLPISYENQCRACHPTTFDRKDPKDLRTGRPLIHGLQP